ncbi:MAG: penicillin-binding protein 2 [Epsilonproteobacteria bacterium]|nr:penicillin-binding protein 2 [Campylobacterota bacterium]NPA56305.1 penicillin-binding protein 2 [Campylobacterota bacterium]
MATSGKTLKIASLFILFVLGITIFVLAVLKIIVEDRDLRWLIASEKNRAIRGAIISSDGYQLAYSNKVYRVEFLAPTVDPAKRELFINLVHIYSDIPKEVIRKTLRSKGYVVLAKNIDTKRAYQLKLLNRVLLGMNVFRPYKINNRYITQGLTIVESGEERVFPYEDLLTPVIGHIHKIEDKEGYIRPKGVEGLEGYYNRFIKEHQDGLIRGRRDIRNNIILNKEALIRKRIDGYNLHLNINVLLQKNLENILDNHRIDLDAKEIIAAVMESDTGKILAIASSRRYNASHITKESEGALNISAIRYTFEPGSVMKPITFALLLEHKLVNLYEMVKGYNGVYKLGKKVITDEHKREWFSAENVIVYSSNIGIAQLAQRLPYDKFYKGLLNFGFGSRTGIDLPNEGRGLVLPIQRFKSELYKANVGYGYSIEVTFAQLLNAYNAFNNEGKEITPRIGAFLSETSGKRKELPPQKIRQVISSKTANTVKEILVKVVEKGTGRIARIEGLQVGGKTGTARIARGGRYRSIYNSSFFGFANDRKHRYTIGVTVIEPKERYFASQTAVPVFREIVLELINEGYLSPRR